MLVIIEKLAEENREQVREWPIWEKEVSSFTWEYTETEEVYVIKGQARITSTERPESIIFGAGDLVTFPKGLKVKWEILSHYKHHYKIGEKTL